MFPVGSLETARTEAASVVLNKQMTLTGGLSANNQSVLPSDWSCLSIFDLFQGIEIDRDARWHQKSSPFC